jgi:DNA-binding protein YbaB
VEQREITESEEFTGRAEVEAVEVRPRGSGHIQEVSVRPILIEQRQN